MKFVFDFNCDARSFDKSGMDGEETFQSQISIWLWAFMNLTTILGFL
jgi:hypothetical protein